MGMEGNRSQIVYAHIHTHIVKPHKPALQLKLCKEFASSTMNDAQYRIKYTYNLHTRK